MEIQLKYRILGAIITVLVLAIALPIVLDHTRHLEHLRSDTPEIPKGVGLIEIENKDQIRQEAYELYSGEAEKKLTKQDPQVVEDNTPAIESIKADKAGLDNNNQAVAWVIQINAFKERKNAAQEVSRLRNKGYKAFADEFPIEGLTRVYVGPELQRNKIEELQKKLTKDPKYAGVLIKRWQPGK